MGYFFESDVWNNGARELFFLAQNVREDKKNSVLPWNKNNTEFEGERQNMMHFSCMKAV